MIRTRNDHLDSHSGQHDFCLSATLDGEHAGALRYSEYQGQVYVQMIDVVEGKRHRGVGAALIVALQEAYPTCALSFGITTEAGEGLLKSLEWRIEPNEVVTSAASEIANLRRKLCEYQDRADKILLLPADSRSTALSQLADWNDILDRVEELEMLLNTQPAEFRFVVGVKEEPVSGMTI